MFRLVVRSTKPFYENSMYTPPRHRDLSPLHDVPTVASAQGTKKCYSVCTRGNYHIIHLMHINSRMTIYDSLSFDMYFFECTDFTAMPRNCQNCCAFISTPSMDEHQLVCIVYLPSCASHVYYLEWKGKCANDLADFVTFNSAMSPKTILESFTFKKLELSLGTNITFVQMVLGPFLDFTYICNYNHFDGCLELLPDGPSTMLPTETWSSPEFRSLVASSRKDSKVILSKGEVIEKETREHVLRSLPSNSEIFQVIKKRSHNPHPYQFPNGKVVRHNLEVMHVKVEVPTSHRLTEAYKNMFAIPFLGPLLGQFANVSLSTLNDISTLFTNGISVSDHNRILLSVSISVVSYTVCDNLCNPILITFGNKDESNVVMSSRPYGAVMDWCFKSSHILHSFVFYSQYCHPMILDSSHKTFLADAVKTGSGNRSCSKIPCGITNFYYGSRSNPTLAQSSPVVGPHMCSHHNNYRSSWNSPMLASFLQTSNCLTQYIHHVSRWMNPTLERACCIGSQHIGKSESNWQLCRTTILTFSDSTKLLGFVNTAHVDKKDKYKKIIQDDLREYSNNLSRDEPAHYLTNNLLIGIGKPTTCAYQFLHYGGPSVHGVLYQFFVYDGFKIAVRIHDFACNSFYGHMSTHRTALPLLVSGNRVYYNHEKIGVFAWGKS